MPDLITAISFDHLVLSYGLHVENLLQETDDEGQPVHHLDDLLGVEHTKAELRALTLESLRMLDSEGLQSQWSGVVVDN